MTEPCWKLVVHEAAERELASVTGEAGDELTDRLRDLKEREQPTEAPYVDHLSDHDDLFRVRVENHRAICRLAKPHLQVLLIARRQRVYDKLNTAKRRANLAD